MSEKLERVGTIYLPVMDLDRSSSWYVDRLGAELSFRDEHKAILNLANLSVFLVESQEGETSTFFDRNGNERFSLTFEVNGLVSCVRSFT